MIGWHHQLNRHEFEQALGDGEGLGILVCCNVLGCKGRSRLSDLTTKTFKSMPSSSMEVIMTINKHVKTQMKTIGNWGKGIEA